MTSRDFAYWLQGLFEVANPESLTKEQTTMVKNHLNLVFKHDIDKQYKEGDGTQEVHDGKTKVQTPIKWPPPIDNNTLLRC